MVSASIKKTGATVCRSSFLAWGPRLLGDNRSLALSCAFEEDSELGFLRVAWGRGRIRLNIVAISRIRERMRFDI